MVIDPKNELLNLEHFYMATLFVRKFNIILMVFLAGLDISKSLLGKLCVQGTLLTKFLTMDIYKHAYIIISKMYCVACMQIQLP